MRSRVVRLLVVAALGAAILVVGGGQAQGAGPVTCSYVEDGSSGPAGNFLSVTQHRVGRLMLRRAGELIEVVDRLGSNPNAAVECSGPAAATVHNVDSIRVNLDAHVATKLTMFSLNLRGGPMGPGATPEPGGGSEIEITVSAPQQPVDFALLGRRRRDDVVVRGPDGSTRLTAQLNAGEPSPDIDLSLEEPSYVRLYAGPGNDRIRVLGDGPFDWTLVAGQRGDDSITAGGATIRGGPGDDLIRGGWFGEFLYGGAGRDVILGRGGPDHLFGGPGPDLLRGGFGQDSIGAVDGWADRIFCGPAADKVVADRRDGLRGCERRFRVKAKRR